MRTLPEVVHFMRFQVVWTHSHSKILAKRYFIQCFFLCPLFIQVVLTCYMIKGQVPCLTLSRFNSPLFTAIQKAIFNNNNTIECLRLFFGFGFTRVKPKKVGFLPGWPYHTDSNIQGNRWSALERRFWTSGRCMCICVLVRVCVYVCEHQCIIYRQID